MIPFEVRQRFCVQETLAVGDATKTLLTHVDDSQYVITAICATCLVSAAQTLYVGDSSGTNKALSLAASFPQHSQAFTQLNEGLKLTLGEDIVIKPGAAGPSFHVVCEGYILRPII